MKAKGDITAIEVPGGGIAGVGRLVIVPTPIGNLGDMTLRSLDALRKADVIYAEDTRVTGKLLRALDIEGVPLRRLDENVMGNRAQAVVAEVATGATVAYCTDAGMPGISDPGLRLVAAARAAGVLVDVLPGPSAASTAYVTSGTTCPRYYFGGFFPRKSAEQRETLERLASLPAALVFYESPRRLVASLRMIAEVFPHRDVAVCRELTKLHEEVVRANVQEVADRFAQRIESVEGASSLKGEIALVIDPPAPEEAGIMQAQAASDAAQLAQRLSREGVSQKQIVRTLADSFGLSRNEAYRIALEMRGHS